MEFIAQSGQLCGTTGLTLNISKHIGKAPWFMTSYVIMPLTIDFRDTFGTSMRIKRPLLVLLSHCFCLLQKFFFL